MGCYESIHTVEPKPEGRADMNEGEQLERRDSMTSGLGLEEQGRLEDTEVRMGGGENIRGSFVWERSAGRAHVEDFELY